jgi:hypothetical protein
MLRGISSAASRSSAILAGVDRFLPGSAPGAAMLEGLRPATFKLEPLAGSGEQSAFKDEFRLEYQNC